MVEEAPREAHVPTQQPSPGQEARLPGPDVDPGRPQHPARSAAQGPSATLGLIWRLRDRRSFVELRRRGRRVRHGVVAMTRLAPAPEYAHLPPRVAFAVPRRVGSAVQRNTLRRRIRAHLHEVRSAAPERIPSGSYLISLQPGAAELPRAELIDAVDRCLDRLGRSRP